MRQSDLDLEMRQSGIDRQRKRVAEAREKRRESWTAYGQRIISGAVFPVGQAIEREWDRTGKAGHLARSYALMQGQIDPYVAAFVAVATVFDGISQRQRASRLFITVGRQVEWEIVAGGWSKREPYLVRKLRARFFDSQDKSKSLSTHRTRADVVESGLEVSVGFSRIWDDSQALRVGHALVELLRQTTGMIDLVTLRTRANRTDTYVVPTEETEQYIRKVLSRTELLSPVLLPMVVPPYDWKNPYSGGYGTEDLFQPLVKSDRAGVVEQMTRDQMPAVYNAVNRLQGVPFRINRRVLAVYQWAWEHSIPIGDLPLTKDIPVPPLPPKVPGQRFDSEERKAAMREWHLVAGPIKLKNLEAKSKRLHYARLKYLAERFETDNIFFPCNCDFRGRIYTQPTFLTPQGCDAAKGLLEFAMGKPISSAVGRKWLKVHGANVFGVKGSLQARQDWCDAHREQILAVARRPLEVEWWHQADQPWQFLAFCFECDRVIREPNSPSHLPCGQDGSNNGLQVLSLLLRDEVGGQSTNCVPSDEPSDIYGMVADRVMELLRAETNPDRIEWAKQWLAFKIDRDATKRPVMIVPYSGTIYAAVRYVRTWFLAAVTPDRPSPWPDPTKPIGYLTKLIWRAIGDVVVKARELMEWFRAVGEMCLAHDLDPQWITPTGFIVVQDYPDYEPATVRTTVLQRTTMWQIRRRLDRRSKRKHLNAIAPNVVHSLDSSALAVVLCLCGAKGIESIAAVHDGVSVLAEDGDTLHRCIVEGWASLFSEDLVGGLKREIEARLPVKLPDPPAFGSLDPSALLGADYFFS